jgi:uncharacterized protein YbjQ (UPF0145 family)
MAGHSRPKDGVASLAYVPAISIGEAQRCQSIGIAGSSPAMTAEAGYNPMIVTTTNDVAGYRIVRHLGVVRGLTVRSRSVIGNIGAGIQSLFGGNITIYTELAEKAREEAFNLMIEHASSAGANAIVGMRYDANEITDGITEVLAYGSAVVVEPA